MRLGTPHRQTAINDQGVSSNETRLAAGQPECSVGHVNRKPGPTQWRTCGELHGATISGVRSIHSAGRSGYIREKIAVAVPPGQIALTLMPRPASSKATDFVKPIRPNFAAV